MVHKNVSCQFPVTRTGHNGENVNVMKFTSYCSC